MSIDRWLIERIDEIHEALCPGQTGTWQDRALQAVAAAKAIGAEIVDDEEEAFAKIEKKNPVEDREKGGEE